MNFFKLPRRILAVENFLRLAFQFIFSEEKKIYFWKHWTLHRIERSTYIFSPSAKKLITAAARVL